MADSLRNHESVAFVEKKQFQRSSVPLTSNVNDCIGENYIASK